MLFSINPNSGKIESYTDDGEFVGFVSTMGDFISTEQTAQDGGPGSGNHDHDGRPGLVGGSAPKGGANGTSEEERELNGMRVRVAQSIAKKAMKHPKVYDDWASELTADEALEIQEQFDRTHKPDENGYYAENISEYYERIWRMLAAKAPDERYVNKIVDGRDMSLDYEWNKVPYTEPKFGQVIDTQIEDIISKQGFNGVPNVVSKEEMDEFLEQHPEAPIMYRTFTAPNKETLDRYDKGLESGAWYVDCGVGGAKYGQGMYTAAAYPWKLEDLTSIYNDEAFYYAERGMVFSGSHKTDNGRELEAYQLAESEMPSDWFNGGVDGMTYVFFSTDPPDSVVVTKKDGNLVDRLMGRIYDDDGARLRDMYDSFAPINIMPKDELNQRDVAKPLEQMREYIRMNEKRESKTRGHQSGLVRPVGSPIPAISSYIFHTDGSTSDNPYVFEAEKDKGIPLKDSVPSLKDGFYIIDYEEEYQKGKPYSCAEVFRVINGEPKFVDHPRTDFLSSCIRAEKEGNVFRNQVIYPAKQVPAPEPKTSTRRMTLDPSAKMITYEKLRESYRLRNRAENRNERPVGIGDIGAYAAACGYDAIVCSNYGRTIVVLNRTKLILSNEKVEVPREEAS